MLHPETLAPLRAFRQELHDGLGLRQESLCDLLDAVLSAPAATSLVRLSLGGAFRRRWPSTCDALSDGTLAVPALRRLALQHLPNPTTAQRPVWVGDGTVWPHPAAADRWSWLLALAVWQLWLARPLVADQRLPWKRPLSPARLTPGQVRRAFDGFLATLGSPARAPQLHGKAPGRPAGQRPGPARRYAVERRTHPTAA